MKKSIIFNITALCLLLCIQQTAVAAEITLTWDASPDPNVAGYKIYYQTGSATPPFVGLQANEGASPIDTGKTLSSALTGLPSGQVNYFAVTAYDQSGNESVYSNIVASGWVPLLTAPGNKLSAAPVQEVFSWENAPTQYNVNYTLYYGTDPQLLTAIMPSRPGTNSRTFILFSLLISLGLVLTCGNRPKRTLAAGFVALTLGFSLAGCGGSGGSNGVGSISPVSGGANTVAVTTGGDNSYATDLQPATTYYWKVVATDQTNLGLTYESLTYHFKTAAN